MWGGVKLRNARKMDQNDVEVAVQSTDPLMGRRMPAEVLQLPVVPSCRLSWTRRNVISESATTLNIEGARYLKTGNGRKHRKNVKSAQHQRQF